VITVEFKDVALKQVFEVISRSSGLSFLFDKDVKTDQKATIFLKNSTVAAAIHFLLLTNQLEQQVLDSNTILIYPNTREAEGLSGNGRPHILSGQRRCKSGRQHPQEHSQVQGHRGR
jgi:type II secretory pathway component HofQ